MECVLCDEAITNPICPACIREGVRQWLLEERQDDLVPEVDEVTRTVFRNAGDTHCIKCKNLMSTCAYCYTEEIFHLIKRNPSLLEKYLTYFNFDLGHLGWELEARRVMEVAAWN